MLRGVPWLARACWIGPARSGVGRPKALEVPTAPPSPACANGQEAAMAISAIRERFG
ncbi:MAG: hypothetical protein ACLRPT_03990 [Akkermansia muciniphila]